jgi:hypothetical protein
LAQLTRFKPFNPESGKFVSFSAPEEERISLTDSEGNCFYSYDNYNVAIQL